MIKVRIIKNWDKPDLLRQTSGSKGVWGNIQFTTDEIRGCDYVIVLNCSSEKKNLLCPKDNVWCILQEPPNEYFRYRHKAHRVYQQVFTQEKKLRGGRYVYSQPVLPWHVEKNYDDLIRCKMDRKTKRLSFITSNKTKFSGQIERIKFLKRIQDKIDFDLYGRGFNEIEDKWDGLAPYQYSLAIENFQGPYYWSEKLADCFLAWTMPIYYGCTNITDYFPKDSLIQIDIKDPDVVAKIKKAIKSNLWLKQRKEIEKARNLVLKKYQFFPFIHNEIKKWERKFPLKSLKRQEIVIPKENMLLRRLQFAVNRMFTFTY